MDNGLNAANTLKLKWSHFDHYYGHLLPLVIKQLNKKNIHLKEYYGAGVYGRVFSIGNGKIIKITPNYTDSPYHMNGGNDFGLARAIIATGGHKSLPMFSDAWKTRDLSFVVREDLKDIPGIHFDMCSCIMNCDWGYELEEGNYHAATIIVERMKTSSFEFNKHLNDILLMIQWLKRFSIKLGDISLNNSGWRESDKSIVIRDLSRCALSKGVKFR